MDTPPYHVHVFFPYDEDQGDVQNPPIRICVSRPVPSGRGMFSHCVGDSMFFKDDQTNKQLVVKSTYHEGRMVQINPGVHETTGWYTRYELEFQNPGVDLKGDEITLVDIETGVAENYEVVNSGRGPRFLFKNIHGVRELQKWHCIHPDVYTSMCRNVGKQDQYVWAYQRFLKPIPDSLKL
jgi:hypothetical protein